MKRLYIFLIICAAWLPVKAQVSVSIQILPPYPTKITDYASRPQLMVISVMSTSNSDKPQRIQLRGAVTGNNGVELRVKANYKSIAPITLGKNEVRMLNGNDLKYFFDYTKIDYKGITQGDFISKNGLPEGTYRFCVRAYDYDSNAPLSADEPVGCSNSFTISSLEPPTIISPLAGAGISSTMGQTILFQWSTPPGTSPQIMSAVRYRIRMVEIIGNRNANNALMSATQPMFFQKEVMGNNYVYSPADPQLTPGRKYAFMIQAYDPFNSTPFRNNGRSEVREFTYTAPANQLPVVKVLPPGVTPGGTGQHPIMGTIPTTPDCDCKTTAGTAPSNNALTAGVSVVNVGNFKMHIISVTPGNGGLINGEGTMELPFVGGTPGARLRVIFTDLDVGTDLKMKSGQVEGKISGDAATLIPTTNNPTVPDLQMQPGDAQHLEDYFSTHAQQMLTNLKNSANSAGFELPMGISKGPVTIAISRIHFNATQAWFEAAASVDIPDGGDQNILALSGRNICISSADGFCKQGQLYLSQDFNISALKMLLKKQGADPVTDPGTIVTFNKDGLVNLSISADYTFPDNSLTDVQTNQPLTANLTVLTSKGWTDWLAQVKLPQFYVAGMKSITFDMNGKPMYYDHSDFQNPQGIPAQFASPTAGEAPIVITPNLWHGFYIPEVKVKLPAIIKSMVNGGDGSVTIAGQQIIVDANGVTGTIKSVGKILELGDGSMDGWYASIDNVDLAFFKSAFKQSSMTGKVVLPASTNKDVPTNQLTYNAMLTTPANDSGLAYAFNIVPTNGAVSFDALFMNVTLDGNTQILVQGNSNDPLKAEVNLSGDLSILSDPKGIKIPGLGKLSLPHINFGNLKFQTYGNFINTDQFYFALTSGTDGGNSGGAPGGASGFVQMPDDYSDGLTGGPSAPANLTNVDAYNPGSFAVQQKLAGFNFSLSSSGLKVIPGSDVGTSVGMSFNGSVSLAEEPIACKAIGTFTLLSGIKKENGRIKWTGINGRIDSVSLGASADLGAFKIKGAIKYYNNVEKGDEGFVGALETGIADLLTINMRAQFGMITNSADGDYNYFNFNAMADLGETGITFAPPIPIAFYGFGGGVYYNMDLDTTKLPKATEVPVIPKTTDTKNVPATASSSHDPKAADDALALLTSNPANLTLTPHKGSFGLQATVLFGLTSRNTLDADATFSIGFNDNGGLRFVKLNGNARILTDVSKPLSERRASSTGAGSIDIEFNRPENTFLARLDMELGLPFVGNTSFFHAVGGGEFYYGGKDDWHLKIGSPAGTKPGPNTVTILNFIRGESYFEVGENIDNMPDIPDSVLVLAGVQQSNLKRIPTASRTYNPDATEHNPSGLILGASASLGDPKKEYKFLMFFGTLYAQTGFDLSLLKGVSCDNVGAAGGPGGWYARGQAYLGAKAKIGMDVNLLLIHGKFTIFEAGAGAIIQAGLPNPAWAEGTIGGYFSILDGAIASNFHFGFSIGEKCINANSDPFGGLEIISQVSPASGSSKAVPLTTLPSVVFNIKNGGQYGSSAYVNGDFEFDDYEQPDKNGNPAKRYFRFDRSCLNITLNGIDVTDSVTRLDDAFSLGYKSNHYLAKNTPYNFKVVAKMREGHGAFANGFSNFYIDYGNFVKKTDNSGDASQTMETNFKTDSGFAAIPATEYAMTGPLHSHKAVPTQEFGGINGSLMYIESKRIIDNTNFFKYPEGTTYAARVFRNGVQDGADRDITMQVVNARMNDGVPKATIAPGSDANLYAQAHSRWTFAASNLQPGSNYVVTIIAKLPKDANTNPVNMVKNTRTLGGTGIDNTGNNNTKTLNSDVLDDAMSKFQIDVLTRTLSNHLNSLAGGESIAAAFNFRTSGYQTYDKKFASFQITKLLNNVVTHNKTIAPGSLLTWLLNKTTFGQWVPPVNGKYNIRLGSTLGGFNFPVEVTFVGELFNKADIDGTSSDEVFQPDYSVAGGTAQNYTIKSLYKRSPVADYSAEYLKLRNFIAANTGISASNIIVTYTSPGKAADNGWNYSYITGGEETEYSTSRSNIGSKIPTALPQANNNIAQIGQTGMAGLLGLPSLLTTPILYDQFSAENLVVQTRGQISITDPIQQQIDQLKNWAVNPGDNVATQAGNGMSNVGVWEGVSTAASGLMNGTITQGQLPGAIQGAAQIGAQMR